MLKRNIEAGERIFFLLNFHKFFIDKIQTIIEYHFESTGLLMIRVEIFWGRITFCLTGIQS